MNKTMVTTMKKIVYDIMKSESELYLKQYNEDINVFPVTFVEFYHDLIVDNHYKLVDKFKMAFVPMETSAFYQTSADRIIIFLNQYKNSFQGNAPNFNFIFMCYHEARHVMQRRFNMYSYDSFLNELDSNIKNCSFNNYMLHHDEFSFEIGANMYGVEKAKKYMMKNFPSQYELEKENISIKEENYQFNYFTYDSCDTVDFAIQIMKDNKYDFRKATFPFSIFYNSDLSYKSIDDIMSNDLCQRLDKRCLYAIFSSNSFLEQVDISSLSYEEKSILIESLEYYKNIYFNQLKYLDDKLEHHISNGMPARIYIQRKKILSKYQNMERYLEKLNKLNKKM